MKGAVRCKSLFSLHIFLMLLVLMEIKGTDWFFVKDISELCLPPTVFSQKSGRQHFIVWEPSDIVKKHLY